VETIEGEIPVTAANEAALRAALESAGAEFIDENFESLPSRSGKNWPLDAFLRNGRTRFFCSNEAGRLEPAGSEFIDCNGRAGVRFREIGVQGSSRIASLPPL
jgi:hypothetical protein